MENGRLNILEYVDRSIQCKSRFKKLLKKCIILSKNKKKYIAKIIIKVKYYIFNKKINSYYLFLNNII